MTRSLRLLSLVLVLLTGCKKESDPISVNSAQPTFVFDALNVTAAVKTDSTTNAPATFLRLTVTYHFIGKPGSLDGLMLGTGDVDLFGIFEPYRPMPIGQATTINQEMEVRNTFPGRGSILVRVGFGGRFWETDSPSGNMIPFSVKDSMWVPLQR